MTICFLTKIDRWGIRWVCLAEKKRGFRAGKVSGYGGKLEDNESLEECAIRETREEAGVAIRSLRKVAEVAFCDPGIVHECHVYLTEEWEGCPTETEEMLPHWYRLDALPFHEMGQADPLWVPFVLNGERLRASFCYDENNRMFEKAIIFLGEGEDF